MVLLTQEVAHNEMKHNLKLGKNQCRDFSGQIVGISNDKQIKAVKEAFDKLTIAA